MPCTKLIAAGAAGAAAAIAAASKAAGKLLLRFRCSRRLRVRALKTWSGEVGRLDVARSADALEIDRQV